MEAQTCEGSQKPKRVGKHAVQMEDRDEIGILDVWARDRQTLRELVEDVLLEILREDDEQAYRYVSEAIDVCHRENLQGEA